MLLVFVYGPWPHILRPPCGALAAAAQRAAERVVSLETRDPDAVRFIAETRQARRGTLAQCHWIVEGEAVGINAYGGPARFAYRVNVYPHVRPATTAADVRITED